MRRRRRVGLLAVLAVGVAALWFVYLPRPCAVTPQNFQLIHVGMTEEDVFAILGQPGDYRNADTEYAPPPPHVPDDWFGRGTAGNADGRWQRDSAEIDIRFVDEADGRRTVCGGICCNTRSKSHDPFVDAWWRARQRWRRWLQLPLDMWDYFVYSVKRG
jgi:hypothetical protein